MACWSSLGVFGLRERFFGVGEMVSSEDSGSRASASFFGRPRRLGGSATSESTGDARDSVPSEIVSFSDLRGRFVFNGGASSGVDGIEGRLESPWPTRVGRELREAYRLDER